MKKSTTFRVNNDMNIYNPDDALLDRAWHAVVFSGTRAAICNSFRRDVQFEYLEFPSHQDDDDNDHHDDETLRLLLEDETRVLMQTLELYVDHRANTLISAVMRYVEQYHLDKDYGLIFLPHHHGIGVLRNNNNISSKLLLLLLWWHPFGDSINKRGAAVLDKVVIKESLIKTCALTKVLVERVIDMEFAQTLVVAHGTLSSLRLLDYVMTSILMLIFFMVLKVASSAAPPNSDGHTYDAILDFFTDEILAGNACCTFSIDSDDVSVSCSSYGNSTTTNNNGSWVQELRDKLASQSYMRTFEEMVLQWMMSEEADVANGIFYH
jgi:hypothetical protein